MSREILPCPLGEAVEAGSLGRWGSQTPAGAFPAVWEALGGPGGRVLGLAAVTHPVLDLDRQTSPGPWGESGRVRLPMPTIDQRGALGVLTKPRLLEIAAALDLGLPGRLLKPELVDAIATSKRAPFPRILEQLRRNELKDICQAADIDDSGRAKAVIVDRILGRRPDGTTDTLTKAELMDAVAAEDGVLNKDAEVIVNTALAAMVGSLRAGSSIEIRGFGSFRHRDRPARIARNPATGAAVKMPAKWVCYFKPGWPLRELVNS